MTEKEKEGGAGKIIAIVLAVAVACGIGVFAYRSHVINTARTEAVAAIDAFDVTQYDGDELDTVNKLVADAKGKLEASKDKEEFAAIVKDFNDSVAEVKTTAQKKKEEAERKAKEEAERKAAEEAARAAAAASKKKSKGSRDSGGCVGGGADAFY